MLLFYRIYDNGKFYEIYYCSKQIYIILCYEFLLKYDSLRYTIIILSFFIFEKLILIGNVYKFIQYKIVVSILLKKFNQSLYCFQILTTFF